LKKNDSSVQNGNLMYIYVDKGKRLKIDQINFTGNNSFKEGRLQMLMKKNQRE